MATSKKKMFVFIIDLLLLTIVSLYRGFEIYMTSSQTIIDVLGMALYLGVPVGIVSHWATTVVRRVMHKTLKAYLLTFAGVAIFWFCLQYLKWHAVTLLDIPARFAWYLYYIPMIFVPLLGMFTAFYMDKDEEYRIDKRWNLMFIPAALLVLLVTTNDIHQWVFTFKPNLYNWNTDYSYNFGYVVVLIFIVIVILVTARVLFSKWRVHNRTNSTYLPVVVLGIGVVYFIIHGVDRMMAYMLFNLGTFTSLWYILFWESCIQAGIIQSNENHDKFFKRAEVAAQILDNDANVLIISKNSSPLTRELFLKLKEQGSLTQAESTVYNLAQIDRHYVAWSSDVSKISEMKRELSQINDKLFGEVELLQEEKGIRENLTRVKRLSTLHNKVWAQTSGCVEKIDELLKLAKLDGHGDADVVLKKITAIACYVKRKSNLLLVMESFAITDKDMISTYSESFKALEFLGAQCSLNYSAGEGIDSKIHLICYDFFEAVLELTDFASTLVFVNATQISGKIRFSLTVENFSGVDFSPLKCFKSDELGCLYGELKIYDDEGESTIVLIFSREGRK